MTIREIPIMICVGNPIDTAQADETYAAIEQAITSGECYRLDRRKVTAAAIEFLTVLYVTGSLSSVAALLWCAYDKVTARHNKKRDGKAILYIAIAPEEGLDWSIGDKFTERETFVRDFELKVSHYLEGEPSQTAQQVLVEVRCSEKWVRTR
jgi:hypothetical protein